MKKLFAALALLNFMSIKTASDSYLWIIPNSGHSTPIYKRDQFNQVVSDFFKQPYRKIEGYARFN